MILFFLAASSISRSLAVGLSVGQSVVRLCAKVTFRVSDGNYSLPKTFLPTYLCDSSDSCDKTQN